MNRKNMLDIVQRITDLAFKLDIPNSICPEIVQACIELRMLINWNAENQAGVTAKGTPMPQTPEEWAYLGELYERGLVEAHAENSRLRIKINTQAQRLEKQRRTITGMLETPDEY